MLPRDRQAHHRGHAPLPERPHRLRPGAQRLPLRPVGGGHVRAPRALVQRLRAACPAHRPATPGRASSPVCSTSTSSPCRNASTSCLELQRPGSDGLADRVRILQMGARRGGDHFLTVGRGPGPAPAPADPLFQSRCRSPTASARSRPSGSTTTATTGIWTPGVICATGFAPSRITKKVVASRFPNGLLAPDSRIHKTPGATCRRTWLIVIEGGNQPAVVGSLGQ